MVRSAAWAAIPGALSRCQTVADGAQAMYGALLISLGECPASPLVAQIVCLVPDRRLQPRRSPADTPDRMLEIFVAKAEISVSCGEE